MELSPEQSLAYDAYVRGANVFVTGPGGSGKSELIRAIYRHATQHGTHICVTALTGCAALLLHCKAKTLHSWAGIGHGAGTVPDLVDKIRRNSFARKLWLSTQVLVVDEVSMLSCKLFELLDAVGRGVRRQPDRPFGGIQLVFSGDFFQLPPVGNRHDPDSLRFCFESAAWNATFAREHQIELRKIFRQADDVYAGLLNQIREGRLTRRAHVLLQQHVARPADPARLTDPTTLFPTRAKVEQLNAAKMAALEGSGKTFVAALRTDLAMTASERGARSLVSARQIQLELEWILEHLQCEREVVLKLGAQVMCITNIKADNDSGDLVLCNGSQGKVVAFCPFSGYPHVQFAAGCTRVMSPVVWPSEKIPGIGVAQIPLILSWAITIHKSQGATLEAAEIDTGSAIFENGQTYVALSRVKSLDGLYLSSLDVARIQIDPRAKEFYAQLRAAHAAAEPTGSVADAPAPVATPVAAPASSVAGPVAAPSPVPVSAGTATAGPATAGTATRAAKSSFFLPRTSKHIDFSRFAFAAPPPSDAAVCMDEG